MASEPHGTTTFIHCRQRLERAVADSCGSEQPWAECVAAAIRAALELAEADPAAGHVLTVHAANRGGGIDRGFADLVDRLASLWSSGAPPVPLPELTAHNAILRIARQVLLYIETRPATPVTEIVPDLVVFSLTPYVGLAAARRAAGS
jgi:hypothetical protein